MGAAAEHRGNRLIARQADAQLADVNERADRSALCEEVRRLRERVARLETDARKRERQLTLLRSTLTTERESRREEMARQAGAYRLVAGKLGRILEASYKETGT